MNPEDAAGAFSSLAGIRSSIEGPGRAYTALPSLGRLRWLFPADDPVVRRAGIEALFNPGSIRGRMLKRAISVGGVRGRRVYLDEETLHRLEDGVARIIGTTEVRLVFFLGVPGAYRKITAQVTTPAGGTLAYARLGASPLAQEAIEAEHRNLLRLAEGEALAGSVPEALGHLDWQGGKVLLVSGSSGPPGPERLARVHADFCEGLFNTFRREQPFGDGFMWSRLQGVPARGDLSLPRALLEDYGRALELLDAKLGSVPVPLSMAHRDFVPWNTRLDHDGLFVFDWERAEEGMTPLYDLFHFQAMQSALFRRRVRFVDDPTVERSLRALWPGGGRYLPWLYLAYLLDMSLYYSEARARAPHAGERGTWGWYADRIGAFLRGGSTGYP